MWILLVAAAVGTAVPSLVFGYAAFKSRGGRGGESVAVFPAVVPMLFLLPVWVVAGFFAGLGLSAWGHGAVAAAGVAAMAAFALYAVLVGGYVLVWWVVGTRRAARLNRQQVPYPD